MSLPPLGPPQIIELSEVPSFRHGTVEITMTAISPTGERAATQTLGWTFEFMDNEPEMIMQLIHERANQLRGVVE